MSEDPAPLATVVITTKNRKEELARAIRSALAQSPPVEVLVVDDGSDDGTADMVRTEFPAARLERCEESGGYIVRRNMGAELARGPVIFSIDDDAEFATPDVVAQTLPLFDDPVVGAVAIPFKEPNKTGETVFQLAPDADRQWMTAIYIGTAHAVRRDVFLRLGGYRGNLIHQGEESDYCIRMMDAGYRTVLGRSDPILHYESPKRDYRRIDYYGTRNMVLFAWQNAPMPVVVWRLIVATGTMAILTFAWPRLKIRLRAIVDAYGAFPRTERRPVSRATFALFRRLKTRGPIAS